MFVSEFLDSSYLPVLHVLERNFLLTKREGALPHFVAVSRFTSSQKQNKDDLPSILTSIESASSVLQRCLEVEASTRSLPVTLLKEHILRSSLPLSRSYLSLYSALPATNSHLALQKKSTHRKPKAYTAYQLSCGFDKTYASVVCTN